MRERFRAKYQRGHDAAVSEFVRERSRSPSDERALRAALRTSEPLATSHWFQGGIQRAAAATGIGPLEAIDLIEAFLVWAYTKKLVPQTDVAVQIAQLELHRRAHGAVPRAITFPDPLPGDMQVDALVEVVCQWEAFHYAACAFDRKDGDGAAMALVAVMSELARHLASTSGLPIQLDRLEPARFATHLEAHRTREPGPIPVPDAFEPYMLEGAAEAIERLAARGVLPLATARDLARDLDELALAFTRPRSAA